MKLQDISVQWGLALISYNGNRLWSTVLDFNKRVTDIESIGHRRDEQYLSSKIHRLMDIEQTKCDFKL